MFEALQYEFMRNALAAGLLASIACGIIGSYVVVKRIVFVSGGISHTAYGGIGLGYWLGFNPILGAAFFSLAAAVLIGSVSRKAGEREDTLIGLIWAVGMALGVVFVGLAPGYSADLLSYLFGSILTVPAMDLAIMLALDLVIIFFVILLYKEFLALCFDPEYAALVSRSQALNLLLLCLIALTVVILIRVVGVILVIAMLTIPAAISGQFTGDLKKMMLASAALGVVFTTGGLWLSYLFDIASGATIILVSGAAYLLALGVAAARRKRQPAPLSTTGEEIS